MNTHDNGNSEKVVLSWSGGKDSAMALYTLASNKTHQVAALLTTVTDGYERISMHGVRCALLESQAESLGIPLDEVRISQQSSNEEYETKMKETLTRYRSQGIHSVAFGDIFLEDLKKYRENNLARIGMAGIFPIWKRDTSELARTFIALGFKAVLSCVDSKVLDRSFAGREFDTSLLADLPSNVDPCGENGEFHSFVYDGPVFRHPVAHRKGDVVLRDNRFYFCDLIPVEKGASW